HPLLKNWLSDSFEDYPYANQAIENSQRLLAKRACNPATEPRTPAEILHSLAKKTYDVTVREPVRVLMGGRPFTARWTYFWKPADRYSQSGFGSYGVFGNNFGSSDFEIEGANVHVDSQIYFKFMVDRMKDAQRSTIEAIEWALQGAQ
ncbi:MAG: hypothetical protein KDD25_03885, partial [Bdellovibrionales bacterium]|nr:hypothetical protein [Bdellovibrionales bacterium]